MNAIKKALNSNVTHRGVDKEGLAGLERAFSAKSEVVVSSAGSEELQAVPDELMRRRKRLVPSRAAAEDAARQLPPPGGRATCIRLDMEAISGRVDTTPFVVRTSSASVLGFFFLTVRGFCLQIVGNSTE